MKRNAEKRLTAKRKARQRAAFLRFRESVRKSKNWLMAEHLDRVGFNHLSLRDKQRVMELFG